MFSQLIVINFTKTHLPIPFEQYTGFTRDALAYYEDGLFEDYGAYLFNYERWNSRPLLQVVFVFENTQDPPPETVALVTEVDLKYRAAAKVELVDVLHKNNLTICGYASLEKYPDLVGNLTWLTEPIKDQDNAESSTEHPPEGETG